MTQLLRNFAIAGYRSFGINPQYFEQLNKITLLIGQNNVGKSNVIRFLMEIYPKRPQPEAIKVDPLDKHQPTSTSLLVGWGEKLTKTHNDLTELRSDHPILVAIKNDHQRTIVSRALSKLYAEKMRLDGTTLAWSLVSLHGREERSQNWLKAIRTLQDTEVRNLFGILTGATGSDRVNTCEPEILRRISPYFTELSVALIPAVREIGAKRSISDGHDGAGIIEKLARLQNPEVHDQDDKLKFEDITNFLRSVINNPTASIEVPHTRETILVHMDGKTLPLSSLGSGVHEVLILATAATVLTNHLVCIEEPEIHLNPILQKKLVRYLSTVTSNQYIISTHSAALMDTPAAEIYHIRLLDGCSIVNRVSSNSQKSAVCEDLGCHPSDLLQANCVIWVEGPSDRIYLNFWLSNLKPNFIEGIHYSVMFYGGRLASHLSNEDIDQLIEDFISLRRLNRRGVMLMDSDRVKKHARINGTKRRLEAEFEGGPGHAWITDGREIENYLPFVHLKAAILAVNPSAQLSSDFGKFDRVFDLKNKAGKRVQASKVEVARHISLNFSPDFSVLDLRIKLTKLVAFIVESNPNSE